VGPNPSGAVLVAHSLGCLAAARWVVQRRSAIRGMFLVAPPDTAGPKFPAVAARTFTGRIPMPLNVPGPASPTPTPTAGAGAGALNAAAP